MVFQADCCRDPKDCHFLPRLNIQGNVQTLWLLSACTVENDNGNVQLNFDDFVFLLKYPVKLCQEIDALIRWLQEPCGVPIPGFKTINNQRWQLGYQRCPFQKSKTF